MKLFTIFSTLLFVQFHVYGIVNDYIFERISPDAGFAFNAVSSIVEDENGFIWFGCNNGVYHYNNLEFTKYRFDPQNENTPQSNIINKLYKDWNNRIWACSDNGVSYFNQAQNSFVRIDFKEKEFLQTNSLVTFMLQYEKDEYLIVINKLLFKFNINEKKLSLIKEGNNLFKRQVSFLNQDKDGNIYIGTATGQLYIRNNNNFEDYKLLYKCKTRSTFTSIQKIDSQYWIGTYNKGIEVIDKNGTLVNQYSQTLKGYNHLPHNWVKKIIQRKNGEIWIATFNGILVIGEGGNTVIQPSTHNQLPHNSIYELYLDQNDGVWVGTWRGGLAYYNSFNYRFEQIKKLNGGIPNSNLVISSFAEAPNGNIWVGSEHFGLFEYNLKTKEFENKRFYNEQIPFKRIKSMTTDKNDNLWIGTFEEGFWKLKNQKIERITSNLSLVHTNTSLAANNDQLWFTAMGKGLFSYDIPTNKTTLHRNTSSILGTISSNYAWKVFIDSKDNLWVCSEFGLSLRRKNADKFERFFYNKNDNSISRNNVYTIAEDNHERIWIGTSGGGIDIYDPKDNSFHRINQDPVFETADIYSIIKDRNGNMWISSDEGIFQYQTKLNSLKKYNEVDGLLGKQYSPNSGFISSEGQLFFGGANGFNIINPLQVKTNPIVPDAFLSKFLINYNPINDNNTKSVDSKSLASLKNIELAHNQNTLVFGFVANNFIKASKNKFKYRIENYLDDWIEIEQGQDVSLAKIPHGNYTLEFMSCNNDGIWNEIPKKVNIEIHPPFWLSIYAFMIYMFALTAIFVLIIWNAATRVKIRNEMIAERYKHEAEELLFSEKTKFFTNVSHEFRTPLTLIISPLNNLISKFENDKNVKEHLKIIQRSADRLLRLTNQILDFRLIELGKVKVKIESHNIVSLCENTISHFDFQLSEKEINCIFKSEFKSFTVPIDPEKIEKVVYNLLSNAVKFSPEKGQIILSIEQSELHDTDYENVHYNGNKFSGKAILIKVRDNGKGINEANLSTIFNRFFVDADNENTGTGIGLHICQEYIRLHNGNIMVESKVGKATIFSINLPIEKDAVFEKENIITQSHYNKNEEIEELNTTSSDNQSFKKVILFAEDNDELRIYLKGLLMKRFKVLTAKNGKQAMEIASEVLPDLIISDILMPGIDGLELTNKIREKTITNHIPIILLTALTDNKYIIDSMQSGANAFLTKPVDEKLLFAQIENIFGNRDTLTKKLGDQVANNAVLSTENETFVQKADRIIENNLLNPEFNIEILADELGVSRSSLHRKIKQSTNQSPSEYVRDMRLTSAIKLMRTNKYNIDEIGTYVGFNSTSYFIRSFKKKYGQTPKEYYTKLQN